MYEKDFVMIEGIRSQKSGLVTAISDSRRTNTPRLSSTDSWVGSWPGLVRVPARKSPIDFRSPREREPWVEGVG